MANAVLILLCAISFASGRFLRPLIGGGACAAILAAGLVLGGSDDVVPFVLVTALPWLAGAAVRSRARLVDALGRRTEQLESERDVLARLSVQRERARIARELHDIVAHHLAVIVVQAGAGRMAGGEEPGAPQRFARIRQSGEQALSEMERLVDLLQTHDEQDHRIDVLLDQAQAAGLRLSSAPFPDELALSPEAERLAYRVVQEGLTNAMKHAPGSEVRLRLTASAAELEIVLENSGGEPGSALAETGSGLGLKGLRERLEALGGSLEAAPSGGGWRLRADLPLA